MINFSSVNTSTGYMTDSNVNIGPKREAILDTTEKLINPTSSMGAVTDEFLQKSLDRILKAIQPSDTSIDRSIHEITKQVVYKVKDNFTGEVIRQFPEEKLVEAAAKLIELAGIMVDKKV
ncbi:flagellar protein FlaG [Paenibacillus sp. PL2-23]|uniref:flagellar protein FlaG n=1 Tax=Paenibacillus sp. PL2-23 TaxID=2100729 RepID=UPI0030F663FC